METIDSSEKNSFLKPFFVANPLLETVTFLDFPLISAEMLKDWTRCQRQFYFKSIRRLQWPSDSRHFRLGKDVHKLLDYHARGLSCELLLMHAPMDVRVVWQKLSAHPLFHAPILASEWGFHVPLTRDPLKNEISWITGRVDRIIKSDETDGADKGIAVIDWKTGTGIPNNPKDAWQTRLYCYAVFEILQTPSVEDWGNFSDYRAEQLSFIYVEVKPDEFTPVREVVLPYSQERHEETREKLLQIISRIRSLGREGDAYALPDNGVCPDRFCSYRPVCGIESLRL